MFWRPEWWPQTLSFGLLWLLSNFTNAVCSYNLLVMSGYMASALAMCALAYWLTKHRLVALLAGYAFAFSPFAQAKATGHPTFVHQEFFPLIMLLTLMIAAKPTRQRALGLGATIAAAGYFDGYYLLFSWMTFGTLAVVIVFREWRQRRRSTAPSMSEGVEGNAVPEDGDRDDSQDRSPRALRMFALAGATALVLLVPLGVLYASESSSVTTAVQRADNNLDVFSADLVDFVVPGRDNPLFDQIFGSWQDARLGLSNYSEKTLFLGWSTLLLSVVALVRIRAKGAASTQSQPPDHARLAVPALVVTGVVLAIASGPRTWHLGGVTFPGVSYFINAIFPFWRAYSRLFIPVHAAFVATAAVGMTVLFEQLRTRKARSAVLVCLATITTAETMRDLSFDYRYFDYRDAPDGYAWVANQADADLIADYPVWHPELQPDSTFATFQPVHGAATVNSLDSRRARVSCQRQSDRPGRFAIIAGAALDGRRLRARPSDSDAR